MTLASNVDLGSKSGNIELQSSRMVIQKYISARFSSR
jgi:hypothetical protein